MPAANLIRPNHLPWAVYIRVSTKDQGVKFSPAKQLMAAASHAKALGVYIPGVDAALVGSAVQRSEFILFDKQTGKNEDRPDFQRGYDMARDGKIGGLIIYSLDRAARDVPSALKLRRQFRLMGVEIEYSTQSFDHTPAGDMMFTMYAAFAQYEGQIILDRTADGRLRRVEGISAGGKEIVPRLHSGGSVLYGFEYKDGVPVECDKEIHIAKLILGTYAAGGVSGYEIAHRLKAEGYRTREGKLWTAAGVRQVLSKAQHYAGTVTYRHGIEAAKRAQAERNALIGENTPIDMNGVKVIQQRIYPPVISQEIVDQIAANRALNKKGKSGRPSTDGPHGRCYLLSRLLWCSAEMKDNPSVRCAYKWTTASPTMHRDAAYRCNHVNPTGARLCRSMQVSQQKMERTALDAIRSYLRQPEIVHAMMRQEQSGKGAESIQRRSALEKRLAEIQHEQNTLDREVIKADLPERTRRLANERLQELQIEEMNARAELRRLSVTVLPSKEAMTQSFQEKLAAMDDLETFEEKLEFLKSTVRRMETDGCWLTIYGTIAVAAPAESTSNMQKNWNRRVSADSQRQPQHSGPGARRGRSLVRSRLSFPR